MKTFILLCMARILAGPFVSAQVPSIDQFKTEPVTITTGISFKFHSKIMNEDRIISIGVPPDYDKTIKKYPVFYAVDGQWNFNFSVQALGWLSDPGFGMIPKMIVVTVHTLDNRTRDLTPTRDKQNNSGGGADTLYQFIKEELIPFVEKNYRTYNYKVLCGSSFGGLFVMNAFVTDPGFFNGYLSTSPSMWWDNKVILDMTGNLLSKNPEMRCRLYITMANEGIGMGVDSLAAILEKYPVKGLAWKYDKHPDEVHETINHKGIWDGIKFIMADWYYPLVDFGTKDHLYTLQDANPSGAVNHQIKNQSDKILDSRSGLYLDSYLRVFLLTKTDKKLQYSSHQMPTLTLYPEAENKFFLKETDVQNNLFLKGADVQFEFVKEDSVVVTANGKIDCSAKKIKCKPIVELSANVLNQYEGMYLIPEQGEKLHITKEGNLLKVNEVNSSESSKETFFTYLYPVGENTFFVFIRGEGFEVEFVKNEADKISGLKVSKEGKVVQEMQKIS